MSSIGARTRKELRAALVTRYHRKHVIRVLNGRVRKFPGSRGRGCLYDQAVTEKLVVLWEASDQSGGGRRRSGDTGGGLLPAALASGGLLELVNPMLLSMSRPVSLAKIDVYR